MSTLTTDATLDRLLRSPEPAVRHLARTRLAGEPARPGELGRSSVVRELSGDHGAHPYGKWRGAFWRVVSLVELGVGPSHRGTRRALEEALAWLDTPAHRARPVINGRVRRCATQEGLGLVAAVQQGLIRDERVARLAATLVASQWPDGGWNCDRRPGATNSSFHESWAATRGLWTYGLETGEDAAERAARRGADFLLRHGVYCSERTGRPHEALTRLRWPPYWHYDVLVGLTTLARTVGLDDQRVAAALDVIEAKRRPDGTWRADGRWWKRPGTKGSNVEAVNWGPAADELLTIGCLEVLSAAGR